jgi:Ca2+-binding RTX toxin-like protein
LLKYHNNLVTQAQLFHGTFYGMTLACSILTKQSGITNRFLVLASAFLILMAPLFVVLPAQEAFAANKTWDGGGDGILWSDCDNWNGNVCPAANDAITIGSGSDVIIDDSITLGTSTSVTIYSGATLEILEVSVGANGAIHNSGTMILSHHERTALVNTGTIINDGLFRGMTELQNVGTINNKAGGTVEVEGGDPWYNTGPIVNEGTFFNNGGMSNDGTIANKCGGTFTNQDSVFGNPVINEPCSPTSCDNPTITGTNGNDVIDGTPGIDVINGKGGDDMINGLGGNDIICGGAGNDNISGGLGNDVLNGGSGNDTISGNGGNDKLFGSSGNDKLNAKDGIVDNDSIDGGFGTDTCNSNPDPEVSCEI